MTSTGGRRRTAAEVHRQWASQGVVVTEAVNSTAVLVAWSLLGVSIVPGLIGLVVFPFGIVVDAPVLAAIGGALLALGLVLFATSAWQYRTRLRGTGPVWTVDRQGITVDGVGPVPWADLEPPRWRLELAAGHAGFRWVRAMPLTPAGSERGLGLHPKARAVLNVAALPVMGSVPLRSVLIPEMKDVSRRSFATFLTVAHAESRGHAPAHAHAGSPETERSR